MKRTALLLAALLLTLTIALGALSDTTAVRIISYNIRLGTGNDGTNRWELRRHASVNMILSESPTAIGIQEALADQLEYLLDSLPDYDMVGVGRDDGLSRGEHMAILYNTTDVELLNWGTFWLSPTPSEPSFGWDSACKRTCTWARFRHLTTGKQFMMLNTHLDHKGAVAQHEGLRLIARHIKQQLPLGIPIFLTGDMNITPEAAPIRQLDGTLHDARTSSLESDPRGTFNRWGRADRIIDYIFFRHAVPVRYTVLRDKDYGAPFISDHYPILFEAELPQ